MGSCLISFFFFLTQKSKYFLKTLKLHDQKQVFCFNRVSHSCLEFVLILFLPSVGIADQTLLGELRFKREVFAGQSSRYSLGWSVSIQLGKVTDLRGKSHLGP